MKLYATTTSERASKGQGGNSLEIIITNEEKANIATINAHYMKETGNVLITFVPLDCQELSGKDCDKININTKTKRYIHKIKGKQQKGKQQKGNN